MGKKIIFWKFSTIFFVFLFVAMIGWYFLNSKNSFTKNNLFTNYSNTSRTTSLKNPQNSEKMLSSEVTFDCKIRVKTNTGREFFLNSGYDSLDPNKPLCYQFLLNKISPTGNFLVYQSISGGLDSQLVVYNLRNINNEAHNIGVFGSATIRDIGFLTGDILIALIGIPEDFQSWGLFRLNLMDLYRKYPNNYGKDNVDVFTGIESVGRSIPLPDKNKNYSGFIIGSDTIRVDTVDPNVEFVEFKINDL